MTTRGIITSCNKGGGKFTTTGAESPRPIALATMSRVCNASGKFSLSVLPG